MNNIILLYVCDIYIHIKTQTSCKYIHANYEKKTYSRAFSTCVSLKTSDCDAAAYIF